MIEAINNLLDSFDKQIKEIQENFKSFEQANWDNENIPKYIKAHLSHR